MRAAVESGLDGEAAAPVGSGYLQALVGYTAPSGLFARAEAGWHPLSNLALFGYGEDSTVGGLSAGAGVRLVW